MYKLSVSPEKVQETLSKHILADGYDLTFDIKKAMVFISMTQNMSVHY